MIKENFKAIHREELDDFMRGLDVFEKYINGNLHCTECNAIINKNNFGAAQNEKGVLIFYCNDHTDFEYKMGS